MKRETFKNKVIANAFFQKISLGKNCKGHNRQLIATVLLLFFCNKNSFAKISKTQKFSATKKMKRETFKAKVIANAYFSKNKFGEIARGTTGNLLQLFYHYFLQ